MDTSTIISVGILSTMVLCIGFLPRFLGWWIRKDIIKNNPEDVHLGNAFQRCLSHGKNDEQIDVELDKHVDVKIQQLIKEYKRTRKK